MGGIIGGSTKPIVNQEQRLSGVTIQTSAYGAPIGLYYGPNRAAGNLLWYGDFQAIEHRSESSAGGKGGGSATSVNISYTYRAGFIMALGEGQVSVTKVMPDASGFSAPSERGLEIFAGTLGQTPWGVIAAKHPAEALGYSGIAYMAAASYDLGGNASLPNFSIELVGQPGITTRLAGYIQHFASDPVSGVGFPAVRLSGLTALDAYLFAQSVTFSPFAVERKPAADYLKEWCSMANTETVWSDGLLKFKPRLDTVGIVANLTVDDFICGVDEPPVEMSRSDPDDAFNSLQIQYLESTNEFNTALVTHKDQANIDRFGLRPAQTEVFNAIKTGAIAGWAAEHRLKRKLYVRNQYTFSLTWKWCRLEPMDVVTITEPLLGLNAEPVLIIEITESAEGDLTVVCEEYSGLVNGVVETAPVQIPVGGGVDQGVAPGDANVPLIFQPPVSLIPSGPEIWLATSGGEDWGGCEVWASLDDASYRRIGVMNGGCRHGTLRAGLGALASPDETNTLAVHTFRGELLSGTTQDAEDKMTLCYVDGEMIAYRDSTLIAAGDYDLTYLVRGCYGTSIGSHSSGSQWARLDEMIFKYQVPVDWFGRTVFVKLVSFNVYGLGSQALADVDSYEYEISGSTPPLIAGLDASVFQTTVRLEWSAPEDINAYSRVDVLRSTITPADFEDAVLIGSVSPRVNAYTDPVGESGVVVHYWVRLISVHGDIGLITGPVSATTGSVGGVPVFNTVPSTNEGDIIYVRFTESLYEWSTVSSSYEKSEPSIAATRILAGTISVALTLEAANIIGGSLNIANLFKVTNAGIVTIKNASTGARQEITNDVTKVFDAAGTLRVKMGNLA